jgi:hypothetical protein
MVYKPLSDAPHRQFGPVVNKTTPADDEIADLPGGVFFSARHGDTLDGEPAGLYYKDGTGNVRRVRFSGEGQFMFAPIEAGASFASVGEVLFVPEVDPRAWTAVRESVSRPLRDLLAVKPGSFFTALGTTENPSSQRRGVYRLGRDGMFRRLLKDQSKGLTWSSAIPADRFGHFGQTLTVSEE